MIFNYDFEAAIECHHVAICHHNDGSLALALCDEDDDIVAFTKVDLPTANEFGQKFCEAYNAALAEAKGLDTEN